MTELNRETMANDVKDENTEVTSLEVTSTQEIDVFKELEKEFQNSKSKKVSSKKDSNGVNVEVEEIDDFNWDDTFESESEDSSNDTNGGRRENGTALMRLAYSSNSKCIHFSSTAHKHINETSCFNVVFLNDAAYIAESIPGCKEFFKLSFGQKAKKDVNIYNTELIEELIAKLGIDYPNKKTSMCLYNVKLVKIAGVNAICVKANEVEVEEEEK